MLRWTGRNPNRLAMPPKKRAMALNSVLRTYAVLVSLAYWKRSEA